MGADGHCQGKASFAGVSLSLTVADEAEAAKFFAALADGGAVQMPLAKTFFSPRFGLVADRFGVTWLVILETCGRLCVLPQIRTGTIIQDDRGWGGNRVCT